MGVGVSGDRQVALADELTDPGPGHAAQVQERDPAVPQVVRRPEWDRRRFARLRDTAEAVEAGEGEPRWVQLRQYVDGAETLDVVLAQPLDAAAELEELAQAGYVLERPVEADGLVLGRLEATSISSDAATAASSQLMK